jgi:serine/threonine protein kinase
MVQSARPTIGKYALGERINFGGPGEVFRAQYRREQVAIRLLPATLVADPDFAARFEREMDRLAALDHPQIVPILSYGQQDGVPYIVTPLEAGESLRDRFARNRPLPEELLGFLHEIATALDYAHAQGIYHGDLNPSHIVLTGDEPALVANFGLAALCDPEGQGREADPRTDVAALARIAQRGLTGSLSAAALAGASSPGLAVIRRAIAKEYDNAGSFVRDLADAHAGSRAGATVADELPTPEIKIPRSAAPRPTPRLRLPQALVPQSAAGRRVALMWVAGFVLAVVIGGGGLKVLGGRGKSEQNNAVAPPPVASKAPASTAPVSVVRNGDLPFDFPIDNALIASKYAEAQGKLPKEASDGKLHRFAAECSNPRVPEDCLMVFVFYSKKADQMYNYHFKVKENALIGEFVEPAQNDDYRIGVNQLPWEKNRDWARLVTESYAQLPPDFAPGGYTAALVCNPASLNNGSADWSMVYVDKATNRQIIFELLSDQVTKLPE